MVRPDSVIQSTGRDRVDTYLHLMAHLFAEKSRYEAYPVPDMRQSAAILGTLK